MEKRIFHGNLSPADLANALSAAFNRSNLFTQSAGSGKKMTVQISSRPLARSGGHTALTITIQKVTEGVLVQLGKQAWMGIAASLGQTAFAAMRNPFSLLHRFDDIAQDIENLQLDDDVWDVITKAAHAAGASHELSEKLQRLTCEHCKTANPVGEASCIACGAPLGDSQPRTCLNCGYVVTGEESVCPNCDERL
ncbi:MAG: zinc ribbon domain-containing protein [Anaerolineae bacterium]|jgi:RNA polymerase subunit RPABC4/transcription elongation factor Spt4|nr:zinc ribbon domain-containing protein [Anaerolineae bacterium]MBT3713031.1 zinc ribbon domain-containing protein [Anaerolineae bacterium]MBT4310921.1 zinc ribbon domain-containing protein [Anaerolineae bacterium]MBT4459138.1 zinc ribbon domain-containing protein [Anaerolineae bacterium]MBT4840899.1 zinc ribbon domain-containing protein [Anaerolineae bacterium]